MKKSQNYLIYLIILFLIVIVLFFFNNLYKSTLILSEKNDSYNKFEGTINITNIKKQIIPEKILNNMEYCNGKNENPSCVCQKGYSKWVEDTYMDCVPDICMLLKDYSGLSDDVYESNTYICSFALTKKELSFCIIIENQLEKDICLLSYVSITNNTDVCQKIAIEDIKNECLK